MTYFIADKLRKSIHNYESVNPELCDISSLEKNNKIVLFNENEIRDLLLYHNYNGCPFCLKKYYLERRFQLDK